MTDIFYITHAETNMTTKLIYKIRPSYAEVSTTRFNLAAHVDGATAAVGAPSAVG
jgi:hypothetical protein